VHRSQYKNDSLARVYRALSSCFENRSSAAVLATASPRSENLSFALFHSRWSHCFLLVTMMSITGCGRFGTPISTKSDDSNRSDPTSLESNAHDCRDSCLPKTISAVRAQLGLDPDNLPQKGPKETEEIMRAIQAECKPPGSAVFEVGPVELLDDANNNRPLPGVLMDSNGHLHLLLGAVTVGGSTFYQMVHGTSQVALVPESAFLEQRFPKAWRLHNANPGVPIAVGSGVVRASEIDHNFGEIRPNQKVTHTFTLTNVGELALVLAMPSTSCGCTTTSVIGDTVLKPGRSIALAVDVASRNTSSLRQYVYLTLTEPETNLSRKVLLSLFGSQAIFKSVEPAAIDFGLVRPGRSYLRSVTVTETPVDRYELGRIDSVGPPLSWRIANSQDSEGLRSYRVTFELNLANHPAGKYSQIARLITDSRFSPEIPVPIIFEVAPRVSVIPSAIALGELPVGEMRDYRIRFRSANGDPLEVKLKTIPREAAVRIERKADGLELVVSIKLLAAGLWQDTILANVTSGSHQELIEIKCAGIGTRRKL